MSKPVLMEWDDDAEDYEEVWDAKREAAFWDEEERRAEAVIQWTHERPQTPADGGAHS